MSETFPEKTFSSNRYAFPPSNVVDPSEAKRYNERTPRSKVPSLQRNKATSKESDYSGNDDSSSKTAKFQLSVTSPSFIKTQYSTPKNCKPNNKSNSAHNSTSNDAEFSITNPFENQSTLDSLLQPSLSPSVFASSNHTFHESVSQSPGSFWNIDQIALMKPADIDISKFNEQQNFVKFEPSVERKAQKAIDTFFANGINLTSPWSSSDHPHYLAIISPAVPSSSRTKKLHSRRDATTTPNVVKTTSSLLDNVNEVVEKTTTVSTQTALSIPVDIDLTSILGQYFTQNDPMDSKETSDSQSNEILSNSSLRRKLFFQDGEDYDDSCFESAKNSNRKPLQNVENSIDDFDAFPMTIDSDQEKKQFSAKENMQTPLFKKKCSVPDTPNAVHSPFSSSPVAGGRMFDLGTPYRALPQDQSDLKHFSPAVECSPIQATKKSESVVSSSFEKCRSKRALHKTSTFNNMTPVSLTESNVSNCHFEKALPENETDFAFEKDSKLSSPPLSPIQDVSLFL